MFSVLVILLSVSLSGCGQSKSSMPVDREVVPVATTTVSSDDVPTVGGDVMKEWKVYRNEKLGFEAQYPAGLRVTTFVDRAVVNEKQEHIATTTGANLFFEMNGEKGTNLHQAGITAEYAKMTEKECLKSYTSIKSSKNPNAKASSEVRDGVVWYKIDGVDAAAGNQYRLITYVVPRNNMCFTAGLLLHSVERMNYDEKNRPTEYDPAPFIDTFEKMIARVKFLT